MECELTVRAQDGVKKWAVDEWTAFVALGVLSAEPETWEEFSDAVRRYLPDHELTETAQEPESLEAAVPGDQEWCLVDLVGRTVIGGGRFELPDPHGAYQPDEGEEVEGFPAVWMDTPRGWLFRDDADDWQEVVNARAQGGEERLRPNGRIDTRRALYGRPLLAFLAERVLAAAEPESAQPGSADDEQTLKRTREIHAAWLMTAREDLRDRTPREILLADQDPIQFDLEHRSFQWSRQGHAPPALPRESAAYRYGGFAVTQIVIYFELIRALLSEAWDRIRQDPNLSPEVLVERLADHRDEWWDQPFEEGNMTSRELIECERRRMPVTSEGNHLDCDCPLCQAHASGQFGPAFMWFDGHHLELEDEFAFSMIESRKEWEREQESYGEFSEEMDSEEGEHEEAAEAEDAEFDSAWKTSFVDWEKVMDKDTPLSEKFAIGFPLAELVGDLKKRDSGRSHLKALNEAFAGFYSSQDPAATRSAAQQLRDQLEIVAQTYPELVSKSADLQSRIEEVLAQD